MKASIYVLLLLLIIVSQAQGQPTGTVLGSKKGSRKSVTTVLTKKDEPAKAQSEPWKESARSQKLKTISFDRRPSAILKAWSTPAKDIPRIATTKAEEIRQGLPVIAATSLALAGSSLNAGTLTITALMPGIKDPHDAEMAALQRFVSIGEWDAVKKYFGRIPKSDAAVGYRQLLQSLITMRPDPGMQPQMMQFMERNRFSSDDVLGLAEAAPDALTKEDVSALGAILSQSLASGNVVEHFIGRLKAILKAPASKAALTKHHGAEILLGAGQGLHAGEFLPTLEEAMRARDNKVLNLLARHFMAQYQHEQKVVFLEQAWKATQGVLATHAGSPEELASAIEHAVELAPKVRTELGQAWLEQSFTDEPQRGMDILATMGAGISRGLTTHPRDTALRLKTLELQKTAVAALLKAAPKRADAWRDSLTVLASAWLREAEFSLQYDRSLSLNARMHRDRFGNFFYSNDDEPMPQYMMMQQQQNMPQPIRIGEILDTRPNEQWLALIDAGVQPKVSMLYAQLYLKVKEEALAFPFIEKLATTHPEKTRELSQEFLRVWTRNHDPNESRDRYNPYMYMYGWETRAESIPLTRSKQERNLIELADWVRRIRALNVGEVDEKLLSKAFTACHSSAEVYRLDALAKVFGSIGALKPRTLSGMAQQMRENLAGLWRDPAVQKDKKTNRKPKDIQAEVMRGYNVANSALDKGLEKYPNHWALHQAKAALLHDQNGYQQELALAADFSANRSKAMAGFQKAADYYAVQAKDLSQEEESTDVFEQWLYASLGACDLKHLSEDKHADVRQPPLIKKAILAMPKAAAERHMSTFANNLFTRLSAVNPALKYRYLKAGLEIVGDHKMAIEARKVFEYYKDLITEIKLETMIDGSDRVGHEQPFGVFVNLRHTREIERESGGFGRYLQNQNNGYFSYNYGRPTNDYRDKFQAAATDALKEHFEVLSVTFQGDKVNSRALPEYGWRFTPYAYLLLKPRGPQIDKVPPVRIDLDFLETSGYVVLPIESATLPIDASGKAQPRPVSKLQVTQLLDERQADKGKLILEVKATALGLIPEFDQILALKPTQFDVVKTVDQGLSVARFDPDSEKNAVVSERSWLITLKAKADLTQAAGKFQFAAAQRDGTELTYQRYQDADLANARPEVDLEETYGAASHDWLVWALSGLAFVVVVAIGAWRFRRPARQVQAAWKLPENLTPFTVLGFLKRIQQNTGLDKNQEEELVRSIALVENRYFAVDADGKPDLKNIAEDWLRKTAGSVP